MIFLKILCAIIIGIAWFALSQNLEFSVIVAIFIAVVLAINPKKNEHFEDKEEFKEAVKNKQLTKINIEERRIMEKKSANEKKQELKSKKEA